MLIKEQQKMFHWMKKVFEIQMKPQFPANFVWPDRHGLDDLLIRERLKRVVNFRLAYSQTFLSRQQKVVRNQINERTTNLYKSGDAGQEKKSTFVIYVLVLWLLESIDGLP